MRVGVESQASSAPQAYDPADNPARYANRRERNKTLLFPGFALWLPFSAREANGLKIGFENSSDLTTIASADLRKRTFRQRYNLPCQTRLASLLPLSTARKITEARTQRRIRPGFV